MYINKNNNYKMYINKKNLITEYLLCLSIMVVFIKKCVCVVTPNLTTQTNITSTTPQTEDDEDFVPYHGERFTVFDWTLFRVFKKTRIIIS